MNGQKIQNTSPIINKRLQNVKQNELGTQTLKLVLYLKRAETLHKYLLYLINEHATNVRGSCLVNLSTCTTLTKGNRK